MLMASTSFSFLAMVAVLVRPDMIFFLPLGTAWLVLRRQFALAALVVLACVIVIAPWTIRNQRIHGRLVLAAATGGVNFWTGNHPLAAPPLAKRLRMRETRPSQTSR